MEACSEIPEQTYPSIPARIKAAEIDALVTLGLVSALIISYLTVGRETPLIILVCAAVLLLYEPVLVTYRGQTIGHKVMGFRIIDAVSRTKISFSKSLMRFLLKSVLGIVSLIWAFFEARQQFLHDRMTASMAIRCNVSTESLLVLEKWSDTGHSASDGTRGMPSLKKRVLFIVMYALGTLVLLSVAFESMFPDCSAERSTPLEQCQILEAIADGLFLVLLLSIISIGLKGGLFGARKVVALDSEAH